MNKKIVITGATKGIGRAIAEKFAAEGWDLAICARNEKDLEDLNKKLKTTLDVTRTVGESNVTAVPLDPVMKP